MNINKKINITNAWICQIKGNKIIPVFGDILISEGRISDIRKKDFKDFLSNPLQNSEDSINAGGRVVTVPMINFHDHFYSRLAKGLPIKGSMENFKDILQNLWWKLDLALDSEMIRASAQMAVLESIRNGVTYIFDHHSSPNSTDGSLEIIAKVLQDFELRGVLCFETTDRNGNSLSENGISENTNFFRNSTNADLKAMLGLHASFTLNDDTLKKASVFVKEVGLGIHIHLCEDKLDRKESFANYKKYPVDRLVHFSLLNDKSILAHGIHLTNDEYNSIEKSESAIVYNFDSNLNNSVGLPEFSRTPKKIPILTGTDGMNSNPARSLKQVFLLSRYQGMAFDQSFELVEKVYFDQLNFVQKYFPDFPNLNAKDRADLIIWDYVPPTPFMEKNFMGHFIYGILDRPVHSVIQNGNVLMNNYEISFNDQKYQKNIVEQGHRLYNKVLELNSD
ncbi:MAG: amidohydrolase family protein [Ignavibacteria bacterium]|nr:amidohydrolase family protein [Ignavibacteria bacterium]